MERRPALDGELYTWEEFSLHYGALDAPSIWRQARPDFEACYGVSFDEVQRQYVTVNAADDDVVPPAAAPSSSDVLPLATTSAPAQLAAPSSSSAVPLAATSAPAQLTIQELKEMGPVQGAGGKQMCQKQRSLRQELLPIGVYDKDLTHGTWNWKQMLKGLPLAMQEVIVGSGILTFSFRLLQNELDPNYRKIDSGERHVFHIERTGNTAVQLHFHKNGHMDPPTILTATMPTSSATPPAAGSLQPSGVSVATPPAATSLRPSGDEAPPIASFCPVVTVEQLLQPAAPTKLIGRNEAHMAFLALLGDDVTDVPDEVGARDVTDEVGFAWTRFLRNQFMLREMLGPGVCKAVVARFERNATPGLVLCRSDDRYVVIQANAKNRQLFIYEHWSLHPMLTNPRVAETPWMQIRCGRV